MEQLGEGGKKKRKGGGRGRVCRCHLVVYFKMNGKRPIREERGREKGGGGEEYSDHSV